MSDRAQKYYCFLGNREQRIGKSFKSFICFLICRNLYADWYSYTITTGWTVTWVSVG